MHCGYVVRVEKLRPHPNADRLQIATFFGNDTCVALDVEFGEVGIYFPSDLQLSLEYCDANHLCRKDANGMPDSGYLEREKRHIKAINLRGEKSDGIYMPLTSLSFTGINAFEFNIGDTITVVNGIEICKKYIPRGRKVNTENCHWCKTKKKSAPIAPLFSEHADTEQLAYNLSAFKPGDEIEITLKMHGTSQRTAYLPVLKGYKRTLWDRITRKEGTPIYEYDYVSGTRRTILNDYDGGFYGSNKFRAQHHNQFVGKLMKGEEVFYEVVGFTDSGQSIMGNGNNEKVGKEFVKQYGKETVFSYGCVPYMDETPADYVDDNGELKLAESLPQSDIYVYRMTMTNEDGFTVEYTPNFMRYRCEQMGVKCVPVFWKGTIPEHPGTKEDYTITAGEWIAEVAEQYYDGPDPIGKTHVREGVVVRIINRPTFKAYKHKNHSFKVLESIIKDSADAPDIEEAEEELKEEA
jgi:hypothetical protein